MELLHAADDDYVSFSFYSWIYLYVYIDLLLFQ